MWVRYEAHLPALSLWDGEKLITILAGRVLPAVQVNILFKNWHLCGMFWGDCEHKDLHVPTFPDLTAAITGLLKTARG